MDTAIIDVSTEWRIRPATADDAAYVFDHLWARGVEELAGFGVSRTDWIVRCVCMIAAGNCVAFERERKALAILGVERDGPASGITWFQATAKAESLLRGLTRCMRRSLRALAASRGLRTLTIRSLCVSRDAPRWFRVLGFWEDPAYVPAMCGTRRERHFVANLEG